MNSFEFWVNKTVHFYLFFIFEPFQNNFNLVSLPFSYFPIKLVTRPSNTRPKTLKKNHILLYLSPSTLLLLLKGVPKTQSFKLIKKSLLFFRHPATTSLCECEKEKKHWCYRYCQIFITVLKSKDISFDTKMIRN